MPRAASPPHLDKISGSPCFYIVWHDGKRTRRTSCNTSDQREAEAALEDFLKRRSDSVTGLRRPDQITIAEALDFYLEAIDSKPGARTAASNVNALLRYWGDQTIDAITTESVKGYIKSRRQQPGNRGKAQIADWTIIHDLTNLRAAVNRLVKEGRLTKAPFVQLPSTPPSRDVWLEDWEFDLLAGCCIEPHVRLFMEIAVGTLSRKQAILDMRWIGQVDFEHRRIYLNPLGRAQTAKKRPVVPMSDRLFGLLTVAHTRARSPFVIEYFRYARSKEEHPAYGRRMPVPGTGHVGDIKHGFDAATRRARTMALRQARKERVRSTERHRWIEAASKFERTTRHTLRHTGATWMAQAGVEMHIISGLLGHSYDQTCQLYLHHHPDYLRSGVDAIEKRRSRGVERNLRSTSSKP